MRRRSGRLLVVVEWALWCHEMSKKAEPLWNLKNPQRPGLQLVYLILHLDSSPAIWRYRQYCPCFKRFIFSQNPKVGQTNYECARVTLSWIKFLQKVVINYKAPGVGAGAQRRGAGGKPNTMAHDPPPHTLHRSGGLERKKGKIIVQSPFIDINNPKVPWPKIYTKKP